MKHANYFTTMEANYWWKSFVEATKFCPMESIHPQDYKCAKLSKKTVEFIDIFGLPLNNTFIAQVKCLPRKQIFEQKNMNGLMYWIGTSDYWSWLIDDNEQVLVTDKTYSQYKAGIGCNFQSFLILSALVYYFWEIVENMKTHNGPLDTVIHEANIIKKFFYENVDTNYADSEFLLVSCIVEPQDGVSCLVYDRENG